MNENTEKRDDEQVLDNQDLWDSMTIEQIERMAEMAAWKEIMGYV